MKILRKVNNLPFIFYKKNDIINYKVKKALNSKVVIMRTILGQYNEAIVYGNILEDEAAQQIEGLMNEEYVAGSKIRIMPDVHAGAGCTIGFTMTLDGKVCPNLVGVDIGCGMLTIQLDGDVDPAALDAAAHSVPSGFSVWEYPQDEFDLSVLRCYEYLNNVERLACSLGTLGGGNHFIEGNYSASGVPYLVIHSGSRNLGHQVARYYQSVAVEQSNVLDNSHAYLEGSAYEDYLHDIDIVQKWAVKNRMLIAQHIMSDLDVKMVNYFETIHNYIDVENGILRKGAVSARYGEQLLIPMNMRDGSLLCFGKGNAEWNYSAPHGAGRLMSRGQAKRELNMEEFEASMVNVYSTSVVVETIDEAPMAYKPMEEIIDAIEPTVEIIDRLIPFFNFKAH